jgi:CubicO group peptidase (beta-lactamase class C family)
VDLRYAALGGIALLSGALVTSSAARQADRDPTPVSLDEFRQRVAGVLEETGVPGAGVALVRPDGIEWAGGIGWADRDARVPVEATTHFRAGSLSKTVVALALVQLYEESWLHLEDEVASHVPDLRIENPWEDTDPVLIAHLLEHTAGFDDMHPNEVYNLRHPRDLPLADVLARNPASRRVRWKPGTRMSYSNPGYAVAGYLIERVTGRPYEEYVRDEIFLPIGMARSSFTLTPAEEALLARGYRDRRGAPVPAHQIYLRPAGNLHTSAAEFGLFVQMLLNWGELDEAAIVDPEYLNRMEFPRTSLAARAGLRDGYGLGIHADLTMPYKVLGHDGGIEGFLSVFGYSPARDAGYVVLLNSTVSPDALRRIASLAIRYLKRDIDRPSPAPFPRSAMELERFVGYYHPANPRNQLLAFADWIAGGYQVSLSGDHLWLRPVMRDAVRLIPASEISFRRENEVDASHIFAADERDRLLLLGASLYAQQRPRWPIDLARIGLATAVLVAASPLLALLAWGTAVARRRSPGWWSVRGLIGATTIALMTLAALAANAHAASLGEPTLVSGGIFVLTLLHPILAALALVTGVLAWRAGAGGGLLVYSAMTSAAHLCIAAFLGWWGLIGIRTWAY